MEVHPCPLESTAVTEAAWPCSRARSPDGCGFLCPTSTLSFTCLLKPWTEDQLQSHRAPKPGHHLRELSACLAPAKKKPVLVYGPGWSTKHWRTKPRSLWFVFTTPEHRGPLWPLKAAAGHESKEGYLLFSSRGWCMPQDSVLHFLTIIWENIQIMSETGEFWGILALLFWVQNYWHLALNWHHSQKQNSWLKGLFFFLPQYSFHLPHSL